MRRMRGPLWVLAGALAVGGLVCWLALRPVPHSVVIDLVEALPSAREARPSPQSFTVTDATIAGTTRRSILVTETSRLVYEVPVPEVAMLHVSLGLAEEAWTTEGDGVLFRILISAPNRREQRIALQRVVAPFSTPADRGWHDVELDLSSYAGQSIELFFNTNASLPGGRDARGDLALWGAPRIVVRD